MLVILFSVLCVGLILCAQTGSISDILSTNIIRNLNAHDLGVSLTGTNAISVVPGSTPENKDLCSIAVLLNETLSYIFEYISYREFVNFMCVSKSFDYAAKHFMRIRLLNFSPRFLFPNDQLNFLVASELRYYFRFDMKGTDADACDQYEMACIDGRKEESEISSLRIRYLIQTFIHETLYGTDSPIPQNVSQWKMLLFDKLKNKQRNFSASLNRLIEINRNSIDYEFNDPEDRVKLNAYLDLIIEFILWKPLTLESFKEFVGQKHLLGLDARHLSVSFEKEFYTFIQMNLHTQLVKNEQLALKELENIISSGLYSKSLFDRVIQNSDMSYRLILKPDCHKNRMLTSHIHDKFAAQYASVKHMWTRDLNCSVIRDNLVQSHIINLVSIANPDLMILNTIIKAARSDILGVDPIQTGNFSIIYRAYVTGHDSIFDIIFNESSNQNINCFYLDDSTQKITNIFNTNNFKPSKFEIYLKHLYKKADPLPLIFVDPVHLFNYKELICDKFDLRKIYIVDFRFHRMNHRNTEFLIPRAGEVLTFPQIIQLMNVPGLLEVFTSNQVPNTQIGVAVSMDKFINKASLV